MFDNANFFSQSFRKHQPSLLAFTILSPFLRTSDAQWLYGFAQNCFVNAQVFVFFLDTARGGDVLGRNIELVKGFTMTNQVVTNGCAGIRVAQVENEVTMLPQFTFAPFAGRMAPDELETDLLLVSKLYRQDIHPTLHVENPVVASLLKRTVKEEFPGKRGTSKLLQVPLPNSRGQIGRHHLLVGLGSPSSYHHQTCCETFEIFVRTALQLGVERATVAFVPNPMTKDSFTHKATAYKLKDTIARAFASWTEGPIKLREIQIFCDPNAVRHIQAALALEVGTDKGCPCAADNASAKNKKKRR